MSGYKYEVDQLNKNDWHQLLLSFTDASIDQSRSYAEARWPKAAISNLVVKRDDNNIVAAAQVVIRHIPFLRSGIAYIKFGPLWQPINQTANPEHLKLALGFLHEEYVIKRGLLVRIMPPPVKGNTNVYYKALQSAGFNKMDIATSERYIVNLSVPIDELRKNLKGRWRNHLNRAEKHALTSRWLEGKQAVNMFMALYDNMMSRKLFIDTSAITDFPQIYNDLTPALKPRILICFDQDLPVAGAVISAVGNTAEYLFGASNAKGLELDAGYYMQWQVIKCLYEQSITWYDLGGVAGNEGLHQFKSGLVGKNAVAGTLLGEFDCCDRITSRIVATTALKLRELSLFIRYDLLETVRLNVVSFLKAHLNYSS
jgi:lipid II:glycine glycyltransferase (peptidoglycan interpeptide bridge formation enzyme)